MPKIQVLDKRVAELIAAGEVVERPSSVIKELVENSIDAMATKITVEIKAGGVGYIRITDNGCGISSGDIPKAFKRHATSKVLTIADLDAISSLGFRGEALASISAVSKIELTTKTHDSLDGYFYEIIGGEEVTSPNPIGAPQGTTIIIRDVFYNTPARMKFLRSDISEGNAVAQIIDKFALSNPEISFTFIRDTKVRLQTSGNGDLLAVISKIYGREFADSMLKVEYELDKKIKVKGFVGSPSNAKPTRTYQTFFINGRYVRTMTCSVALQEAFKGKIMTGRFPVAVLFLDIDFSQVDANVHPAKIEVRFSNEKDVYNAVYFAVKTAIMQSEKNQFSGFSPETHKPTVSDDEVRAFDNNESSAKPIELHLADENNKRRKLPRFNIDIEVEETATQTNLNLNHVSPLEAIEMASPTQTISRKVADSSKTIPSTYFDKAKSDLEQVQSEPEPAITTAERVVPLKYIGEIFNTYILLERNAEELLLVDKHAAHERIKFEELKANTESGFRQLLLSAIPVTLQREEYAVILENLDMLEKLGFLAEDFGTGTIIVRETAVELDGKDISFLISEIASKLLEGRRDITPEALNQLYYSIACKSAVRGGDHNNKAELVEIIKKLELNPEITHCPHGRPVTVVMPKGEIEKMFGRLG